jgi:hypothetical protein
MAAELRFASIDDRVCIWNAEEEEENSTSHHTHTRKVHVCIGILKNRKRKLNMYPIMIFEMVTENAVKGQ